MSLLPKGGADMKRLVYTVFVDFEDDTGSLLEEVFIEEVRRDIESGVDKEGWCGDVNFVEIRDVKEEDE